ncbi:MAG: patatin-like phospholipase family protein [Bacteroidales bacterium]|nr:patatin-like phospholipase family protein [Bacteroidales bacterium]
MKRLITILAILFVCSSLAAQTPDTLTNGDTIPERNTPHAWTGGVHPPRVGLVLGGGGAKGAAHIGVLKYMEEIGIPISYVTGTSMGSIIGGLYALGYPPDELADLIAHMDWSFYMSNEIKRNNLNFEKRERRSTELLNIPFSFGDMQNQKNDIISSLPSSAVNSSNLLNLFNRLCIGYQDSMSFADLPIPFSCIATDLLSGDSVILNKGEFGKAIRSSMSIPGVFAPVQWNDKLLADGGMVNNFPVDVCRQMGADIIIGCEVGSRPITNSDSLKSLPQQVMQYLSIATMGNNDLYRKQCQIYISPDVTGYNMLSFSTENIDSLVARGYRQAKLHEAEFLALKAQLEKYGPCEKVLQAPRAEKLMPGDRVRIGEVTYSGVTPAETRQLLALPYVKSGEEVDIDDLEHTVSRLRGSGNYLYVHYKLHKHTPDSNEMLFGITDTLPHYDLEFQLIPAKPHTFGIGFHYDSEESAAVLFHIGFNEQRTGGFKAFLDLDLAYNFSISTRLSWSKHGSGSINLDHRYHKSAYRLVNWGIMQSIWYNRFRLYYANKSFDNLALLVGIQQDIFIDANERSIASFLDAEPLEVYDRDLALVLFADITFDNMDDKYFAHRGVFLNANASVFQLNNDLFAKDHAPYAASRIDFKTHIPIGKSFTIIPEVAGRVLIGYIRPVEHIWYYNTIGGAFHGRYFDQQIAFIGTNNLFQTDDILGVARIDLRFQLNSKNYISLIGNTASTLGYELDENDVKNYHLKHHLGLGIRFAHKSFLGPLWLDFAWNSITHSFCGFLNVGYYF